MQILKYAVVASLEVYMSEKYWNRVGVFEMFFHVCMVVAWAIVIFFNSSIVTDIVTDGKGIVFRKRRK